MGRSAKLSLLSALGCQVFRTDVTPPAVAHDRLDFFACRILRWTEAGWIGALVGEFTPRLDGGRTATLPTISGVGFKVLGCQVALKVRGFGGLVIL